MNENENIIQKKYRIMKAIGSGSFGNVFQGISLKTNQSVAIKMENQNNPAKSLKHEAMILNYLYSEGCRNVPAVFWYGKHQEFMVLVMTFYECSLFDFFKRGVLSNVHINKTMIQCIMALEFLHKKLVIHRDIKPQNIMIKDGSIHIIDFGLATFYVNENGEQLEETEERSEIVGTPKYVSYYIHDGKAPARRDDLISLGYIYILLIGGELPWDNIKTEFYFENQNEIHLHHYKNVERKRMKALAYLHDLFSEKLSAWTKYITYCYTLNDYEPPDYEVIRKIFIDEL
jgi:serine/threonine protein kinase